MAQRGRKSKEQLAIASVVELNPRPEPLEELNAAQAEEWVAVVSRLPADWFPRETHQLLAQYCRHVVMAKNVAMLIDAWDGVDVGELDRLAKMQEREGRAISSLATRMRLTQKSVHDDRRPQDPKKIGKKLWD